MIDVKAAFHDADYVLPKSFDLGIFGSSIDDRTQYSIQYVEKYTNSSIELIYDKEQLNLVVNGDSIECHNFPIYLKEKNISSLILDSTSLDVPELALVIKAIASIPKLEVLILYVEPENYSGNSPIFEQETFTLSDSIIGFEGHGIPTISLPVDSHSPRKFVFFLGFEGTRLLNAIETYDVSEDEAKIVFGVPAFQSGWESKSIRSNMPTLKEYKFKGRISYCSASSPKSALAILREAGSSESCEHIYVVPIGTKPNTVGALLYILEKPEGIRLLYDQPKKKVGRSSGVGRKHFYMFTILQ